MWGCSLGMLAFMCGEGNLNKSNLSIACSPYRKHKHHIFITLSLLIHTLGLYKTPHTQRTTSVSPSTRLCRCDLPWFTCVTWSTAGHTYIWLCEFLSSPVSLFLSPVLLISFSISNKWNNKENVFPPERRSLENAYLFSETFWFSVNFALIPFLSTTFIRTFLVSGRMN